MTKMNDKNQVWYEVVVSDSSNLSGKFVAAFLTLVAGLLGTNTVVLDDLSGANVAKLSEEYTAKSVELNSIVELIKNAVQFDWCNFLLFKNNGFVPDENQVYADFIGKTEATIRAVDDSDLYLYTKDEGLVREIKLRYDGVSVSSGQLESFIYPE